MNGLKFAQSAALVALDNLESQHKSTAKTVALRGIAGAVVLESWLDCGCLSDVTLPRPVSPALYEETVWNALPQGNLAQTMKAVQNLSGKVLKDLERAVCDSLRAENLLEESGLLLSCGMLYHESGIKLAGYRADLATYASLTEQLRAEALEEGELTDETAAWLWILRETGCMHDLFSADEQKVIAEHLIALNQRDPRMKALFNITIHRAHEFAAKGFLGWKQEFMEQPTFIGVGFVFPFLQRSQSVFIDTEELWANKDKRLDDLITRFNEQGLHYELLRDGKVPLFRIDNVLYEGIPHQVMANHFPIFGVRMRRVPLI